MPDPSPHVNAPESSEIMVTPPPTAQPSGRSSSLPRLRWSSLTLLAGRREIEIEHEHAVYRLQLTSLGKLILTK
jgi:hemin uptake protein HemP